MSTYLVKEIFGPTLQGEGSHAGTPCVFLRFAVCNLACSWCDTDFAADGAEHLDADAIADRLVDLDIHHSRLVIVTGGEPTLQWDAALAATLRARGFRVHMESNGTRRPRAPVDWLTVSPKPQFHDNRFTLDPEVEPSECKVVVDSSVGADTLAELRRRFPRCKNWFLQPCDTAERTESLARAMELVARHPDWRLSLQLHKLLDVP